MAALTPQSVHQEIIAPCEASPIVFGYTLPVLDPDLLSMRVHLADESLSWVAAEVAGWAGRRIYLPGAVQRSALIDLGRS